jgi:hypothetical protein
MPSKRIFFQNPQSDIFFLAQTIFNRHSADNLKKFILVFSFESDRMET